MILGTNIKGEANMGLINKIYIVIIALLVCSCDSQQIKDPPDMVIEYGYGLDTPGFDTTIEYIKPGARSWAYSTITGIVHMIADSSHPLESWYPYPKIEKTNKVKINISYSPDYYTVIYWPEKYIGNADTKEFDFQTIDVIDNIIIMPNEESGYVFRVRAVWESVNGIKGTQGYADYVFFVSNNLME